VARTGCRYDTTNGIAQCETGGCSSFYDCSKALKGPPAGATLAEWTFDQQKGTDHQDFPDISAVNGVNLNMDIQPVGGSTTASCAPNVCTFQYGYLGSKAWQPPYFEQAFTALRARALCARVRR
jgi:hypothetical protein